MNLRLPESNNTPRPENAAQRLANWLAAVSNLAQNHADLNDLVTRHKACRPPSEWAGQCPLHQVLALLAAMQDRLATLLDEMNEITSACKTATEQKIVRHTQQLDDLNEQAQTLLHLAALSSA